MTKHKYTLGCDPEVFLFDTQTGLYVSAHTILPGTKDEPYKVDKGAIQVDGLAAEFNIDPASTPEEFDNNIATVLTQLRAYVHKNNPRIDLHFVPVARFNRVYFDKLPDICKILGCDPDFDYNGNVIENRNDLQNRPLRTAAGHVHLGFTKDQDAMSLQHFNDCRFLANYFWQDFSSGEYSRRHKISLAEAERLQFYGNNGAFRPKSYGVELRFYSNLWVQDSLKRKAMFEYIVNHLSKIDTQ